MENKNHISVPLCCLNNSRHQVFDIDSCSRTPFQISTLQKISELPEFGFFVCIGDEQLIVDPGHRSKFWCSWYDKTGNLHSWIIGLTRVLRQAVSQGNPAFILMTDPAYTSRCAA